MSKLETRAVLVKFTDAVWQGGMIDRKVGEEVQTSHKAITNTGHYWKRLVPKAAIRPRANAGNAARNFHITNTLPWMDGGTRILPVANFDTYMAGMRKLIAAAQKEESKLFGDYDGWKAEAKRTHGTLFNESHFPTLDQLRRKFGIEIDVIPLPNVTDWRVDLSDEQMHAVKARAEAKINSIHKEGVVELYQRLSAMVEKVKERLSDPEATFRDSLIKNIREFTALIPKLNIGDDKQLDAVRKEVEKSIAAMSPEDLRVDPVARAKTAKSAAAICKKMSGYMSAQ